MTRRTLVLTDEQRAELERIRDRDKRPYLRVRAAALLKIAAGASPHWVACHGLLKPVAPDTVYRWLNDWEREPHLRVRPACRRPFSPAGPRARPHA
jgi:DNA-binding PadR family transcriptional regulator